MVSKVSPCRISPRRTRVEDRDDWIGGCRRTTTAVTAFSDTMAVWRNVSFTKEMLPQTKTIYDATRHQQMVVRSTP
ncbi:MAG: hypothetical protein M3008_14045 [Chloroflexota bacterium]|nr:hypothetical protein [Chloroflexota bacterium]